MASSAPEAALARLGRVPGWLWRGTHGTGGAGNRATGGQVIIALQTFVTAHRVRRAARMSSWSWTQAGWGTRHGRGALLIHPIPHPPPTLPSAGQPASSRSPGLWFPLLLWHPLLPWSSLLPPQGWPCAAAGRQGGPAKGTQHEHCATQEGHINARRGQACYGCSCTRKLHGRLHLMGEAGGKQPKLELRDVVCTYYFTPPTVWHRTLSDII